MSSSKQIEETVEQMGRLLASLHSVQPTRFMQLFTCARSFSELYEVILALPYAVNSKEVRDTGDEEVHRLALAIHEEGKRLRAFLTMKLTPKSQRQKRVWDRTVLVAEHGKYAFRDDDSLEFSLLDSELKGVSLRVRRI